MVELEHVNGIGPISKSGFKAFKAGIIFVFRLKGQPLLIQEKPYTYRDA